MLPSCSCLLNDANIGAFYGSFVAPLAVMLLCNGSIFVAVMREVLRRRAQIKGKSALHKTFKLLATTVGLATIVGLMWISAILFLIWNSTVLKYIFVILSSFQGLIIFIFYVLRSAEVRGAWKKRYSAHTRTALGSQSDSKATIRTKASNLRLTSQVNVLQTDVQSTSCSRVNSTEALA